VLPVPRFNPINALEDLTSLRPTVLAGVPAMFIGMIGAAERKGVPSHSLRITLCGGAPLPLEVARRWEELFGLPLRQGYGLTEASPVCLFNLPHQPNRPGTLGTPFPGVEVSIRDGGGNALPEGEVGQLCIRGDNVFAGYLGDQPGEGPFLGGWLQTGDLASQSGDVVRFRGLLKSMFTRNGFNVYPEEIRRVLKDDPRIDDVLVCARPEFVRENEVVLEVRAKVGATLNETDVKDLCAERLASYKQPSRIRIYVDHDGSG
jgi:long-chain acyl-CoA synthetase